MAINRNFQIKNGITVGTGGTILVSSGSSIGIGTTTPSSTLQVVGTISATTFSGSGAQLTNIPASSIANSSITIATSTGLTGGGTTSFGGTLTLSNSGVTSAVAGTGITISGSTGAVTISNSGVTSLSTSGNGISISGSTGSLTISTNATNTNVGSTIVYRDASSNFSAGTITANLVGTATTATTLQTTRSLWGQNFNGSGNVTGDLSSVGNITGSGAVNLTATSGTLGLVATGANNITASTNGNERLRIDSSGNLGLGTVSPTQTLHVVGNSRITGAQYDSNNSAGSSGQYLQSTGTGTSWGTINTSAIVSKAIAMSLIFGY